MINKLILISVIICMLICFVSCNTISQNNYVEDGNSSVTQQDTLENNESIVNGTEDNEVDESNSQTLGESKLNSAVSIIESKPSETLPSKNSNNTTHTHDYVNATCNSPQKCSCGATKGNALGHNYVNNKCSRCGKTDPESLPVSLDKLVVIDCKSDYISRYKYDNGEITDTFGESYVGYHYFPAWPNMYAIYFLDEKYSTLSLDIVAANSIDSKAKATIGIYVDGVLKYSKSEYTRTTGKVHVDLNVKYGERLKIRVTSTGTGDHCAQIAIVNTKLTK